MATQALSGASTRNIMRYIKQHEATTGKKLSKATIDSLMRQELEVSAGRATQARGLELQQEQFEQNKKVQDEQLSIQRQKIESDASAAKASGYAQVGSTALTSAILLKDTAAGKAVSGTVGDLYSGAKNLVTGGEAVQTASTTQGATTGISEAATPAVGALASNAATSTTTSTAASAGTKVAGGTFAAAGIGRAVFGASGDSTAKDIGTIGTAALYGTYLAPGIGTVIGAAVGVVYDLAADELGTIICTELHRQGLISKKLLNLDHEYRVKFVDKEVYDGYLILAKPVVRWMQLSKIVTKVITPFAKAWAYEMASKIDTKRNGNILGKIINFIGQPICRWRIRWETSLKALAAQIH